jgi:hypothetical protein
LGIIAIGAVIMAGVAGCNTLQSIESAGAGADGVRAVSGAGQRGSGGHGALQEEQRRGESGFAAILCYDKGKTGQQTVTVTLQKQSATFTVTVVPVEKLTIQQPPSTTVLMQGDDFNPAGLVALAEFENGEVPGATVSLAQLSFSGYSKNKGGVQTVTVDYYGKRPPST